ncbi:MAG: hypothetical protein V2I66_01790 [Halieaceae bacterium]|jgi:transcriptional regulator with GAF, ATPase, and Fis domain|nr:hypothetical protein [Halieaceae bacterium]
MTRTSENPVDISAVDERLHGAFRSDEMVRRFVESVDGVLQFDRFGIATRASQTELEVLALYEHGRIQAHQHGRRFAYRGTVGEWVWRRKRPFVGRHREEVRAFPATYKQFVSEGMESNCVVALPLPRRGPTFAYWLSRNADSFSSKTIPVVMRACDYLKPLLVAANEVEQVRNLSGDPVDRALNQLFVAEEKTSDCQSTLPSLDKLQARYIRRVLDATDGRVEGPGGAAAVLGLPASTLRSRMKRLGMHRK